MLKDKHIHIHGLGLMGASMALAVRGKARQISGSDIQAAVEHSALEDGVIDCIGGQADADLIVLAIPADFIPPALPTLQARPGALVMDLGSTKTQICKAMESLPAEVAAVGGH